MARLKMFNKATRSGKTPDAKGPIKTPSYGEPQIGTNTKNTTHPQSHAAFMGLGNKTA
jgi:hypothetical protein